MWDTLWIDVNLATMTQPDEGAGRIEGGALGVHDGRIVHVGSQSELPAPPDQLAREVRRGGGRWILPGLVDCHTHLVYAGNRSREFEARLAGASYESIARSGGGIVATVAATRSAGEDELLEAALPRLDRILADGVTTIEIKSGYGLDRANELKMLRVARRLERERPVSVRTTLLAAHAVPPEFRGRPDAYVDEVCDEIIPAAAGEGLADAVDAFCETIGFTPAQTQRVFRAAEANGLPVKLHADQLSDLGGAELAARHGALSADHLEYSSRAGIEAMAASGTVAVLLPGAFYFLKERQKPPVEAMRAAGVPMAVATDCNPGSSPVTSLVVIANMACILFGLRVDEALAAITRNAARALGLDDRGTLESGMRADFVLFDVDTPAELVAQVGASSCTEVIRAGG